MNKEGGLSSLFWEYIILHYIGRVERLTSGKA